MINCITHIKNEQGDKIETHEGIEEEFLRYFKKAHQEPNIDRMPAINKILKNITRIITEEHSSLLIQPINLQEVEEVVQHLKEGKASGPDGFTSNFFHKFLDLIKTEVWKVVEESRALRWMYPGLNATFIALIPKVEDSNTPDKYRPIDLCNIIYKITSKVIATKLKPLLPLIISPEQSGFFLCFNQWYPLGNVRPSRGIRQGDPLSPFLFVIMAEGLGRSITSARIAQQLKGLSFNNSPAYSHQQIVDDNMLFGHPSVQEAHLLKSIPSNFSDASGALINRVKSNFFFFNTLVPTQKAIGRILGFTIASLPSKYLGAPLMASALKHSSWKHLLEKLETRLSLWTYRALNMASRLVLIKAVLHSMPLYLVSILAAPKWVLKEIKNLQCNFLWGSSGHNRKWALVKWDKVCLPKKAGGIGLRDPEHRNRAMGAKIWWRWLAHPNTPWASLWIAKYASNCPMEERI
eukprot:PITA_31538